MPPESGHLVLRLALQEVVVAAAFLCAVLLDLPSPESRAEDETGGRAGKVESIAWNSTRLVSGCGAYGSAGLDCCAVVMRRTQVGEACDQATAVTEGNDCPD